jgi:hypothetical protein
MRHARDHWLPGLLHKFLRMIDFAALLIAGVVVAVVAVGAALASTYLVIGAIWFLVACQKFIDGDVGDAD